MKQFIDQTGGIWVTGGLIEKPAGIFTGSSTVHGGQETTTISTMIPLLHHGMIIVGVPYSETLLFDMELGGGSPYGASAIVGPDSDRPPTEHDLAIARTLRRRLLRSQRSCAAESSRKAWTSTLFLFLIRFLFCKGVSSQRTRSRSQRPQEVLVANLFPLSPAPVLLASQR